MRKSKWCAGQGKDGLSFGRLLLFAQRCGVIKSMLDPITSDGMVVRTSFFSFFFFVSLFCKLLLFVERCVAVRGMADTVTFQATDFRIV